MIRVLELLTAPCVEDRLRRSALIQLSVMTEDWRLHDIFLEQNGLKAVIDVLKNEIVSIKIKVFVCSSQSCKNLLLS